jgi:succinyl-diaminopimelate desuccinylase
MSDDLILKEIEENKEKYIDFLKSLIQTDSYNPPGNEKDVALKIQDFFINNGVKCEIFPFGKNRANMIAYLDEKFDGKNLLYNGHMDIVPPGSEDDWKYPPLSAYLKRKKLLYGRGSSDMKGGLAAMVIALVILKKLNLNLSGNLIVNAVADEETGGKYGTGWCLENILKKRSIKCDFIIVGEPSGLSPLPKAVILGEKGHLVIKVITNGISCHSMAPFMGKNAIYMMSEIIQNLDKLEDYIPKVEPPISLENLKLLISSAFPNEEIFNRIFNEQPLFKGLVMALTQFTKSLNVIHGGIKENVVPDHCEARIDFRLYPGQTTEMILNSLRKLISNLGYEVRNEPKGNPEDIFVYLEIYHQGEASIWKNYQNSQPLKDFKEIVDKIYGRKSFYFLAPGSTDAHYYRNTNYCMETIHFGPGNAGSMHAMNEYIEIQDFMNAIKVYALFAHDFLK